MNEERAQHEADLVLLEQGTRTHHARLSTLLMTCLGLRMNVQPEEPLMRLHGCMST